MDLDKLRERFDAKWVLDPDTGCHLWTAGKFKKTGYGAFYYQGQNRGAHRISWMIAKHSLPGEKMCCHTCDTPACVNPAHLFLGTGKDNVADMIAKGRRAPTDNLRNAQSRYSEEFVQAIRDRYQAGGVTQVALAQEMGCTQQYVSNLVLRQRRT